MTIIYEGLQYTSPLQHIHKAHRMLARVPQIVILVLSFHTERTPIILKSKHSF
jgi:hypothetical protein